MKKLIFILFLIFNIFYNPKTVLAKPRIPEHTKEFYINDFSNVLNNDVKNKILNAGLKIHDDHDGVQLVVVTVETLLEEDLNYYATEMYKKYKIGKHDRGALFLIATKDRKLRIEVGYGLEEQLTDAKCGRIIREITPYLKNNDWNKGIYEGYRLLGKESVGFSMPKYETTTTNNNNNKNIINTSKYKNKSKKKFGLFSLIRSFLFFLFMGSIFVFFIVLLIIFKIFGIFNGRSFYPRKKQRIIKVNNDNFFNSKKSHGEGGKSGGGGASGGF